MMTQDESYKPTYIIPYNLIVSYTPRFNLSYQLEHRSKRKRKPLAINKANRELQINDVANNNMSMAHLEYLDICKNSQDFYAVLKYRFYHTPYKEKGKTEKLKKSNNINIRPTLNKGEAKKIYTGPSTLINRIKQNMSNIYIKRTSNKLLTSKYRNFLRDQITEISRTMVQYQLSKFFTRRLQNQKNMDDKHILDRITTIIRNHNQDLCLYVRDYANLLIDHNSLFTNLVLLLKLDLQSSLNSKITSIYEKSTSDIYTYVLNRNINLYLAIASLL